ncbi:alpha/beta-hydrolase [Periconia macrospinosa]|uniref:Alpha/beta-hydrolase n=1 Tax=Periconia macrospinosa TaxID=97972 RepID=A0A2V1E3B0_9PLEO|nr:alpha/beta-hydrolase [Periconia macrospinosa]
MKFTLSSLVSLAVIAAADQANCAGTNATNSLNVTTLTGRYTGLVDKRFPGTRQFRSIAYAEPPIQSRRWLPPRKLHPSSEHHYSYDLPPSCPQFMSATPAFLSSYLGDGALIDNGNESYTSGGSGVNTSEDCLHLAVWTPVNATSRSKFPVLFWIYGGGFSTGGINTPYYDAASWVEKSQSHIVVSVNYRVNIFGFPNAKDLTDQNVGLLDQRMALEWVRDNIEAFGGDPTAITQMGQSAGSMSIDAAAHSFYQDPIARANILLSGTVAMGAPTIDPAFSSFTFIARNFGCGGDNSTASEIDCMRSVPFSDIINFIGKHTDSQSQPALSFTPVLDERLVFSDYAARFRAGKVAHVPTILANTANEATSFAPFDPRTPNVGPPQEMLTPVNLQLFVCPTWNFTVARNELDIPVYRYQYAGNFPNTTPLNWTGAFHGSDIPLVFGTYEKVKGLGESTELEIETSRVMQDHILAFVKDPVNGPKALGWEPTPSQGGKVARFGTGGKAIQYVDAVEVDGACFGAGEYDPFP